MPRLSHGIGRCPRVSRFGCLIVPADCALVVGLYSTPYGVLTFVLAFSSVIVGGGGREPERGKGVGRTAPAVPASYSAAVRSGLWMSGRPPVCRPADPPTKIAHQLASSNGSVACEYT
jgi:hypothetical protein